MSLGINLLLGLVEEVARRLGADWDVEIMEMHHRGKVDAPSGTALALGRAVAEGRGAVFEEAQQRARDGITGPRRTGGIGFASLRGGDAVGDHHVVFAGAGERLELTHRATSRVVYAKGYGLADVERQFPGEISSGMRRRVEIVRALINDPKILLLDEPFRALDALTKSVMHEYLLELYDLSHKTIFFITHDLEEAIFLGDLVVIMTTRPGRVKKLITVDLPRPRTYRMLTSKRFLELKQETIDGVHEEALKAFEAGERELA